MLACSAFFFFFFFYETSNNLGKFEVILILVAPRQITYTGCPFVPLKEVTTIFRIDERSESA